jgi:hypothetical protein
VTSLKGICRVRCVDRHNTDKEVVVDEVNGKIVYGPKNKASHPTPDLAVAASDKTKKKVVVPWKKRLFVLVLGVSVVAIVTAAIAIPLTTPSSVPLDVDNSTVLSTLGLDMDIVVGGLSYANITLN